MPYEWSKQPPHHGADWTLSLWPYRSLLKREFVIFIGATAALVALPLLVLLGSVILWVLLPFFAITLSAIWYALHISYRRGEVLEELTASGAHITLRRTNPDGTTQNWQANRHWVRVQLHPTDGPVDNYIILSGGDRKVELGAFLDVSERLSLVADLKRAIADGSN